MFFDSYVHRLSHWYKNLRKT